MKPNELFPIWPTTDAQRGIEKNSFEAAKSRIKEAYFLLNARTPLELNNLYTAEDQKLMKSGSWDYNNSDLIINRVKTILEDSGEDGLTDEEKKWRKEILWFWYHHAISCAVFLHKDKEAAKRYITKALEYKDADHPNKITDILGLLIEDRIVEAEELAEKMDTDKQTAVELIQEYKKNGLF